MLALLSFLIILLPSIVFHLTVYGRTFTFKSLVNSTTISLFVTFWLLIISSIIGTFYAVPLFIFDLLIIYFLAKSSIFKNSEPTGKSDLFQILVILVSTVLWYFLLISPQLDSFQNLNNFIYSFKGHQLYQILYGFSDGDDTIYAYIPWGEILSSSHYVPGYTLNSQFYAIPYISGGYVLIGYIMGFIGDLGIYAIAGIPLYFIFITQLILVSWLNEYELGQYYWIAIGLLLVTPSFFISQTEVVRETYIIPLILLAFYNIFLYNKYKLSKYLYSSLFSLILIASIRETILILLFSIFISSIVVFGYPYLRNIHAQIGTLNLFFISLPVIGWYARNMYNYSNPAYPLFQNIFGNDLILINQIVTGESNFINYLLATGTQNNINFLYPSLFLGILYLLITSYKNKFNRFILFSIGLYDVIFLSLTPIYTEPRYYLYLFNALFVIFSTLAIIKILEFSKTITYFEKLNLNNFLYIMIVFLLISILGIGMLHSTPTYAAEQGFKDMWILDGSIYDKSVLLVNSDQLYKNDDYVDMPALTQTRSISLPIFAYHMFRLNMTDDAHIAGELKNNNLSRLIYVHYLNESFEDEMLHNHNTKNNRNLLDIAKFNTAPIYKYILENSRFERNIELRNNKVASIYYIET